MESPTSMAFPRTGACQSCIRGERPVPPWGVLFETCSFCTWPQQTCTSDYLHCRCVCCPNVGHCLGPKGGAT